MRMMGDLLQNVRLDVEHVFTHTPLRTHVASITYIGIHNSEDPAVRVWMVGSAQLSHTAEVRLRHISSSYMI